MLVIIKCTEKYNRWVVFQVHVVKEIVPVVRERATPAYSAQAGVGGGGLYAAADSPLGSASAGLGDSGPSVTVGSQPGSLGHKPVHNGPGFFDSIFNVRFLKQWFLLNRPRSTYSKI